jgi:hypothetical protein
LPANDFDKNFKLLQSHFPSSVFSNAVKVLRQPGASIPSLRRYRAWLGLRSYARFFSFGR